MNQLRLHIMTSTCLFCLIAFGSLASSWYSMSAWVLLLDLAARVLPSSSLHLFNCPFRRSDSIMERDSQLVLFKVLATYNLLFPLLFKWFEPKLFDLSIYWLLCWYLHDGVIPLAHTSPWVPSACPGSFHGFLTPCTWYLSIRSRFNAFTRNSFSH